MKNFILLSFVLILTAMSCAKTENNSDTPTPTVVKDPTIEYSTLIVGTWKLTEIGRLTADANNSSSSNQGGCGSGSSHSESYVWTDTPDSEALTFKSDGAFVQENKADAACKGSYQIGSNIISIKSDCSQEPRLIVSSMVKTELVLVKTENDVTVLHKYKHL
jgi:hypothetical protein